MNEPMGQQKPAGQPVVPVAALDPASDESWGPEARGDVKTAEPFAPVLAAIATDAPITGPTAVNGTDPAAQKKEKKKKNKKSKARKIDAGAATSAPIATPTATTPVAQV